MSFIARERKRLRGKFIEKAATRDLYTLDRWWDTEYIRAGIPVWLAVFVLIVEGGNTPAAMYAITLALLISVPWWVFITVIIVEVYARYGDKQYMLVTRHHLSKEYRS